ncbi:hypothetical protein CYY_007627 [Polysphondylium violaceum]|uniref:FNIP repeat-containing protein n=1 Tax=Polysphondylium violaceum TaxID=133409 RepID=A0A8J4PWZ0_9MYCE|nr:hypothetical protein CYY_007627 [Polysphondylium violaceum]
MKSFLSIFRNCYLRSLIRNHVFKNTIINIPTLEYLDDNHQHLSVFTKDDKLNHNIYIKYSLKINQDPVELDQFSNSIHKYLVNEIQFARGKKEETLDLGLVHDQVQRLTLYLGECVKSVNGKLPDSIVELNIDEHYKFADGVVCPALDSILSDLPKNLRVLRLADEFNLSSKFQLPDSIIDFQYSSTRANLERLVISNPNKLLESAWLIVTSNEDLHWVQDKYWINKLYVLKNVTIKIPPHVRFIEFNTDAILENLPLELEKLRVGKLASTQNQEPVSKILKQYLPYLKHLELGQLEEKLEQSTYSDCLESLYIHFYDKDIDVGVLPSNLKTLHLNSFNQQLKIWSLPNSITDLALMSYNQPLRPSTMPTQLKKLNLSKFNNTIEANSFPDSLTSLQLDGYQGSFEHVGKLNNLNNLKVDVLNQSIVDILANTITIGFNTIAENTSFARTSITDLCLWDTTWGDVKTLPDNFLPPNLVYLELVNFKINSDKIPLGCKVVHKNY